MTSEVKTPQPVSDRQIQFLEYLIWKSRDAGDLAKKCLILLIRKSEGLTKRVVLVLDPDVDREKQREISIGFHDMNSSGLTTHAGALFRLTGSDFWVDYGNIGLTSTKLYEAVVEVAAGLSDIEAIVPRDPYKE